jgi:hypothetical protein
VDSFCESGNELSGPNKKLGSSLVASQLLASRAVLSTIELVMSTCLKDKTWTVTKRIMRKSGIGEKHESAVGNFKSTITEVESSQLLHHLLFLMDFFYMTASVCTHWH